MHRLFFLVPVKTISFCFLIIFALSSTANELANMFPLGFGKTVINDSTLWNKKFDDQKSEEYRDLLLFSSQIKNGKLSPKELAREVLKNPNTYKIKYHFLKFLQENSAERAKFPAINTVLNTVWGQIPEVYLQALVHMIEESPVKEFYAPIVQRLVSMQQRKEFIFIELTESVRKEWAGLSNKLHVSTAANTLTKDASGKYVVNGAYNNRTKVFAMDLSLSRDENLVTFAHEIVHVADPELIEASANLQNHFAKLAGKLKVLFPTGDVEGFLSALIQHTFMEQGRLDLAAIKFNKATLSSEMIRSDYEKLAEEIKGSGYDYLLIDEDFKGFMQNLIRVSVENEFKAYILSYALYSVLKDENSTLMPPSKKRDEFIREHFDHPAKLQDILKAEAEPFKSGDPIVKLLPRLEGMTPDQIKAAAPETQKIVDLTNILKKLVLNLYFTESRAMIQKTTQEFAPLYNLISNINFSASHEEPAAQDQVMVPPALPSDSDTKSVNGAIESATAQIIKVGKLRSNRAVSPGETIVGADDDFYVGNEWMRAGGYDDSISNPYLLAEAKMGTAAIVRFRQNVEALSRSLGTMHESLLTMMAGILPLNNLNFGELKWIGLMNVNADANQSMPRACSAVALRDMQKQDPEASALFSRFIYNKDNELSSPYIQYDAARSQVYLMQLYKAVTWLRKEFPITRENFTALTRFQRKLSRGDYKKDEISEERASELLTEINEYMRLTRPRQDDLVYIDHLMKSLLVIENAARKLTMFNLAGEFADRMNTARRYFSSLGLKAEIGTNEAEANINASIQQLRTEIRNTRFAAGCAARDDFEFNRTERYVFNFGAGRKIENLTMYCFNRQLYVLRLPCDWIAGATTFTNDPAGFNTKIFIDGRRLLITPFMDLRAK